jgi:hypothetical protein
MAEGKGKDEKEISELGIRISNLVFGHFQFEKQTNRKRNPKSEFQNPKSAPPPRPPTKKMSPGFGRETKPGLL